MSAAPATALAAEVDLTGPGGTTVSGPAGGERLLTSTACCCGAWSLTDLTAPARSRSRGPCAQRRNWRPRVAHRTADLEAGEQEPGGRSPIRSPMTCAPPLRALSGFSEALLEEYGDRLDENRPRVRPRVSRPPAKRMATLIDDQLQLSRGCRGAGMNLGRGRSQRGGPGVIAGETAVP